MTKKLWTGGAATAQIDHVTPANVEIGDIFAIELSIDGGTSDTITFTATEVTAAVAQVDHVTPANVEIGDQFAIALSIDGGASDSINFTATAATIQNVVEGLYAAAIAKTSGAWMDVTVTEDNTKLIITSKVAGVPFAATPSTINGGASDTQTLTVTNSVANVEAASSVANVVEGLAAAAIAKFSGAWSNVKVTEDDTKLIITAGVAGVPFVATPSTINGGAADTQTLTVTNSVANVKPSRWDVAANWSDNAVPVTGDDVIVPAEAIYPIDGYDASAALLASFTIEEGYTQTIGSSDAFLQVDADAANLAGSGVSWLKVINSGQINIDNAAIAPSAGQYGLNLVGTDNAALNISAPSEASIGVGDAGVFEADVVNVSSGNVRIGASVTAQDGVSAPALNMTGGTLVSESAWSTVTKTAGTLTQDTGAIALLKDSGGTVYYNASATLAEAQLYGATLDFSQDWQPKTVTVLKAWKGASIIDPNGVANGGALAIQTQMCRLSEIVVQSALNKTWTAS